MSLTILTPTFNRGYILNNAFESLQRQSNKDFTWLIIDDGSNDNTESLVKQYKSNATFNIKYVYKENGGKHTALNVGIKMIETDFTMILDSDDALEDDAVETIYKKWRKYKLKSNVAAIVFLKGYSNKEVVGDMFPFDEFESSHFNCRINLGIKGDKAEVFKTTVLKEYPFPEFDGESFIGEGIVWNRIGRKYQSIYFNKVIYITEYLSDGLTSSGRKLRIKNPIGGMCLSNECVTREYNTKARLKYSILYGTYSLLAKKNLITIIKNSNAPFLSIITIPFYILLYLYWKLKY